MEQALAALLEWLFAHVPPVDRQEIEAPGAEASAVPGHQTAKIRDPVGIASDDLSIDDAGGKRPTVYGMLTIMAEDTLRRACRFRVLSLRV
jgi:hypothetical protein